MDARDRRRLGVLIAPLLAAVACGGRALPAATSAPSPVARELVQPVPAPAPGTAVAHTTAESVAAAPVDATFRTRLAKIGEPARSLGHAGGLWRIQRWADDGGRRALDGAPSAPSGATIVAELLDAGGGPGPVLAMQKQPSGWDAAGGDWAWTVLSTAGDPLRSGKLADCAACHALARPDRVFGAR